MEQSQPDPPSQPPQATAQFPNQQPLPQSSSSSIGINQHQMQPHVMMCPVQYMYDPQMLVSSGKRDEQVQPFQNQTFLINLQNPPPWSQNRPNVVYMPQMQMPSNIQHTSVPQNMVSSPMFNYQFQPVMTQQDQLRQLMMNQNLIQNSQNLIQNQQNLVQNQQSLAQTPQNAIQNQQSIIQNPQSLIQNQQNFMQNPQTLVQNQQNLIQNAPNFVYNPQNFIQSSQNLVQTPQNIVQSTQNSLRFPQMEQNKQFPLLTQYMLPNQMIRKPGLNQDYIAPVQMIRPQYIRQILTVKPMSSNHTCVHHNAQKDPQNLIIPNETTLTVVTSETPQITDVPHHIRNQILEGLNVKNFVKVSSKTALVKPIDIGLPLQSIAPADNGHPRVETPIYPKPIMKNNTTNTDPKINKRKAKDMVDHNAKAEANVQAKRTCLSNGADKVRYQAMNIVTTMNAATQMNGQMQMAEKQNEPQIEEKLLRNTVFVQARGRVNEINNARNEMENARLSAPFENYDEINSQVGGSSNSKISLIKVNNSKEVETSAETENIANDQSTKIGNSKVIIKVDNSNEDVTQELASEHASNDEIVIPITTRPHKEGLLEPQNKVIISQNTTNNDGNNAQTIIPMNTRPHMEELTEPQNKVIISGNTTNNDINNALNDLKMCASRLDVSKELTSEIASNNNSFIQHSLIPIQIENPTEPKPKQISKNAAEEWGSPNANNINIPKKRGRPRKYPAKDIIGKNTANESTSEITPVKKYSRKPTQVLENTTQYLNKPEPDKQIINKNATNDGGNKNINTSNDATILNDSKIPIQMENSKKPNTIELKEDTPNDRCNKKINKLRMAENIENKNEPHICKHDNIKEKIVKYVLTHVLDGHIIQESNLPFCVQKPTLSPTKTIPKNLLEDDPFEYIDKSTVKSWTVTDIYSRLNHQSWRESAQKLREEEIDGESLLLVSKEQLLQIGISEKHAQVITEFVEKQ